MNPLYTIGYSTWSFSDFADVLRTYQVGVVCDVRSSPFSKRNEAFSKPALNLQLKRLGIKYVFLGEELGARPPDQECYVRGQARYELLAKRTAFQQGIRRLLVGLENYCPTLLCAEREPLNCHRTILVCRNLMPFSVDVRHILGDGSIEYHGDLERRLVRSLRLEPPPMFASADAWASAVSEAYEVQGRKIAYVDKSDPEANQSRF